MSYCHELGEVVLKMIERASRNRRDTMIRNCVEGGPAQTYGDGFIELPARLAADREEGRENPVGNIVAGDVIETPDLGNVVGEVAGDIGDQSGSNESGGLRRPPRETEV